MPDGSVPAPELDGTETGSEPRFDTDAERLRQRAEFLRELADARALLACLTPWRVRALHVRARIRQIAAGP